MENISEKEQVKGFIRILQQLTGETKFDSDKLLPMIDQMLLMGSLVDDFSETEDEEELLLIGERIKRCEVESKKVARDFFGHLGIPFEEIQERIKQPDMIEQLDIDVMKNVQGKMARIDKKLAEQKAHQHIVSKKKKKGIKKEKGRRRV